MEEMDWYEPNNQGRNNQGRNNQGRNNQGRNNQGRNNQGRNNQGRNNQGRNNPGRNQKPIRYQNQNQYHNQNQNQNQYQNHNQYHNQNHNQYHNQNPPDILFITTHGAYNGVNYVESPLNIRKINAVSFGVCNYLHPIDAEKMFIGINDFVQEGRVPTLDHVEVLKVIVDHYKNNNAPQYQNYSNKDKDLRSYMYHHNKSGEISTIDKGEIIVEKHYSIDRKEKKRNGKYDNSIILLSNSDGYNDGFEIDLMEVIGKVNPYDRNQKEVTLSEILNYIYQDYFIHNLIIIDLSCSYAGEDERTIRINRRELKGYYGGYKKNTRKNKTRKNKTRKNKTKRNYSKK